MTLTNLPDTQIAKVVQNAANLLTKVKEFGSARSFVGNDCVAGRDRIAYHATGRGLMTYHPTGRGRVGGTIPTSRGRMACTIPPVEIEWLTIPTGRGRVDGLPAPPIEVGWLTNPTGRSRVDGTIPTGRGQMAYRPPPVKVGLMAYRPPPVEVGLMAYRPPPVEVGLMAYHRRLLSYSDTLRFFKQVPQDFGQKKSNFPSRALHFPMLAHIGHISGYISLQPGWKSAENQKKIG
jgi:hypothetical protein